MSTDSPRAPAPRSRSRGVPAAHEWAQGSAPDSVAAANSHSRCSESSGRSTARCRPKPEAVGTSARSTAPRAGSSTWSRSGPAPGTRRRTSARWSRTPSASACASSRRLPWSASTLSPRGRSTVAASVQGPVTCTLRCPVKPWSASSSMSRSWPSWLRARRWSRPGPPPVSRQPAGWRSAPSSATTASARPVIEAVAPRSGELGQVRQVGQLAHDDAHGLVRVGPGEGADTGREGHAGVSTARPTTIAPWP